MLLHTIRELSEYNHIVVFLTTAKDHQPEFNTYAKVYKINFRTWLLFFLYAYHLRKIICDNLTEVDIVHAHLWKSVTLARFATPNRFNFVFTIHSLLSKDPFAKNKLSLWIEKLTYRSSQKIIAVSETALADYASMVKIRSTCHILHNCVREDFFRTKLTNNTNPETLRLVAVGNLREAKNYHFLLHTLSQAKGMSVLLDIYGSGPQEKELEHIIDKNQLKARLMGTRKDIPSVLPNYDLFIMASLYEGFGIALIEAMATGLPVLISDIPAFREVAGDAAFYFSLHDEQDLIQKIEHIQFLKAENRLTPWREKCRERAKAIASKSTYLEKLRSIYTDSRQAIPMFQR